MPAIHPAVIDFETHAIQSRPAYPPEPIGVSIKEPGKPSKYYAWGHVTGNNRTKAQAKKILVDIVRRYATKPGASGIVAHHAKFDFDVMETHFGIRMPDWRFIHDTMWILFLENPNMRNLGLKPSAEEILGWPAEEKDAVGEWLCREQPVEGVRISRGPKSEFYFMKFLAYAPGDIVGPYANGDTDRTAALFEKLHPRVIARGMSDAYDRERRLMPVLLQMERRGVRVDLSRLRSDVALYRGVQEKIDAWLIKKLGVSRFFNLDADEQLAEALIAASFADRAALGVTATGRTATNKKAIAAGVTNKQVAAVLQYRAQLHTCVGTFMETWLSMAEASGGLIFTNWNQVRGAGKGARTGRLSSTPPFMNIPKEFEPLFSHERKGLPKSPIQNLPPLPLMRSYVVPYYEDHVLIDRDYNQCELRVQAHFGDGALLERYRQNVWLDAHDTVQEDLKTMLGLVVPRKDAKTINLGLIYGMGIGELAIRLKCTVEKAKSLKRAVLSLYPEIEDLYKTMRALAKNDEPLITWGGRENYCEPPTKDKKTGKESHWDYKMVNTMIQGSAGDAAKEAMIRYADKAPKNHFMLIQVHDQLLASVPRGEIVLGHEVMRKNMESIEMDAPLLTEGKWSPTNWAELRDFDKRGVMVAEGLPEQKVA